ncbi:hypothetical protein V8G54_032570 [Vigna mungo]|uniref:Uncharacterized protein n=1 Tax=Vigna mungo TaxID=3915 RepID=A0AAQ3MLN6_VIGMU
MIYNSSLVKYKDFTKIKREHDIKLIIAVRYKPNISLNIVSYILEKWNQHVFSDNGLGLHSQFKLKVNLHTQLWSQQQIRVLLFSVFICSNLKSTMSKLHISSDLRVKYFNWIIFFKDMNSPKQEISQLLGHIKNQ